MSLISKWFSTTLVKDTDSQNTPEVNLQDSFEAIEIDIPTIETAEVQIKGSNISAGTFDLIGHEEPIPSSTGGFRTTVPLGGKYRYIKVYVSAAQTSDRVFAVRGISYVSGGLVAILDRVKAIVTALASMFTGIVTTACSTWLVDSNYGSNYDYDLPTAGAGKVYWITIACRYNTRQLTNMQDVTTNIWRISHEQQQGKSYHCVFNPPIAFSTQLRLNICASGLATVGYIMDS